MFKLDLELLVILLIMAAPVWLCWRWLLRNRINDPTKRKLSIGIATLVSTPVLYVSLVTFAIWYMFHYTKKEFDRETWLGDSQHRYEMSEHIIKSKMLIGKTPAQVKALLGDIDHPQFDGNLHYILGLVPSPGNIDEDVLDITFKDGRVVAVGQHNS